MISVADLQRRTQHAGLSAIEMIDLREAIAHGVSRLSARECALLSHVAEHGVASAARKHHVQRRKIDEAIAQMRSGFESAGLRVD